MSLAQERRLCLIVIAVVACWAASATAVGVLKEVASQDGASEGQGLTEETQTVWTLQLERGPLRHQLSTESTNEGASYQELSGAEVSRRAERIAVILVVTVLVALTFVILCCGSKKPANAASNDGKAAENPLSLPNHISQDMHTRRYTTGSVKMLGDLNKWKSVDGIPGQFSASFTGQMSLDKIQTAMDVQQCLSASCTSSQSSSDAPS